MMTTRESGVHLRTTKKLCVFQLRAGVRQPGDRGTFYPPAGERRADLWWEAMVPALSDTQLTLVMSRRFEVGTLLEADVCNSLQNSGRTLLAQVAAVTGSDSGGWVLRCQLLQALSAEEISELQGQGR